MYAHTVAKGYAISADYGFSLACPIYPRQHYPELLFATLFYLLKLHAEYYRHTDYTLADSDDARVGGVAFKYLRLDPSKAYTELMDTPILYYERFGFTYPEKEEWVRNFITHGHAYVEEYGRQAEILMFYLHLKDVSMRWIHFLATSY